MTHKTLALLSVLALNACGGRSVPQEDGAPAGDGAAVPPTPTVDAIPATRFAVHVFGERIHTTYDYAALENKTRHLDAADARITLTEQDIASYRVGEAPSARIQLTLAAAASARWRGPLTAVTDLHPYLVTLDGKRLYVGVVYVMFGAAAIDTPVLHVEETGHLELRIGSHQGAWMGWGKGNASRIDHPGVRELFRDRDALAAL